MKRIILSVFFMMCMLACLAQVQALDAELKSVDYPFPVSFIHFTIQDEKVQMAYMDVKPEKPNGKTVMLLHGKNFNGAYWEQTAKDLSKNGYRVIIPDQVGFGKSSKPQHIQYSFQLLAQNTRMVLDSLGVTKISVLGHSMGGMVATRFVLMYPGMIDKFILENPIGLEDYKLKVPYRRVDEWYKAEMQNSYEKIKSYQLVNYYDNKWKPEYDKWVTMLAGWTTGPAKETIAWNAALTTDMIMTQPVVYEFENIKAPALLIIGQRDRTALGKDAVSEEVRKTMGYYPDLGRQTAKKIKDSKLVELEGVGHLPHVEAYDRFIKALMEFLEK